MALPIGFKVVPLCGLYLGSYKATPNRKYTLEPIGNETLATWNRRDYSSRPKEAFVHASSDVFVPVCVCVRVCASVCVCVCVCARVGVRC